MTLLHFNPETPAYRTRTNLAVNPSFEQGVAAWRTDGAAGAPARGVASVVGQLRPGAGDVGVNYFGYYYTGATPVSGFIGGIHTMSHAIPTRVVPGQVYSASVYLGSSFGNVATAAGFVTAADAWCAGSPVNVAVTAGSGLYQLITNMTAPANAAAFDFELQNSVSQPVNLSIDGLLVEQSATHGTYADPDVSGTWDWDGTAGQSSSRDNVVSVFIPGHDGQAAPWASTEKISGDRPTLNYADEVVSDEVEIAGISVGPERINLVRNPSFEYDAANVGTFPTGWTIFEDAGWTTNSYDVRTDWTTDTGFKCFRVIGTNSTAALRSRYLLPTTAQTGGQALIPVRGGQPFRWRFDLNLQDGTDVRIGADCNFYADVAGNGSSTFAEATNHNSTFGPQVCTLTGTVPANANWAQPYLTIRSVGLNDTHNMYIDNAHFEVGPGALVAGDFYGDGSYPNWSWGYNPGGPAHQRPAEGYVPNLSFSSRPGVVPVATVTPPYRKNFCTNPKAGSGATTNWNVVGGVTLTAGTFGSGGWPQASPEMVRRGLTTGFKAVCTVTQDYVYNSVLVQPVGTTVQSGRWYAAAYIYVESSAANNDALGFNLSDFVNEGDSGSGVINPLDATNKGRWLRRQTGPGNWNSIESALQVFMQYFKGGGSAACTFYFTGVMIERGNPAQGNPAPYGDGSRTGWAWTGTANLSSSVLS